MLGPVGTLVEDRGQLAVGRAPRRRLLQIGAATIVALVLAAVVPAVSRAAAASYCVHQSGFVCPPGSADEGSNLQAALSAAGSNPSAGFSPNVITIGPGTFQPSASGTGFTGSSPSSYPLEIVGAGVGQTTLTADSGAPAVLSLTWTAGSDSVLVSGLSVTSNSGFGIEVTGGVLDHVAITANQPGADDVGLTGSTLRSSTVFGGSGDDIYTTGGTSSDPNEVDDVTAEQGGSGVSANGPTTIHRAKLLVSGNALNVQSAAVYIDDSLLEGTDGIVVQDDPSEGSVNALNDTLIGAGIPNQGVWALSHNMGGADVQIFNSIVRGFGTPFLASGIGSSIEADHDNFSGSSSVTVTHAVPGDPEFVNPGAGDFHLESRSPLIDASNVTDLGSISSTIDLDQNPRIVSVTNGSTPVDIGAYEYQHRAPTAVASATPSTAAAGSPVTFDGSRSSDPDDGDALTYAWSFDDGATATGATAAHAFSTPGTHTATLTVTDPTGLTSTQQATVTVTAQPAPPAPPANPGGTLTNAGGTSTTPGSPTSPAPVPRLQVLGKPSVAGNKVTLKLSCTSSAACSGIRITETTIKTKTRKQAAQVAAALLNLKAGQTKTITLALGAKGRPLLARFGMLPVSIKLTMPISGKTTTIKTANATLRPSRKTRHRA